MTDPKLDELVERLESIESRAQGCFTSRRLRNPDGPEAAAAITSLSHKLEEMREALEKCLPLIEQDRRCLIESHTMPVGDLSTLDPEVVADIAEYTEAANSARQVLSDHVGEG